jgi:hypothetical protein
MGWNHKIWLLPTQSIIIKAYEIIDQLQDPLCLQIQDKLSVDTTHIENYKIDVITSLDYTCR